MYRQSKEFRLSPTSGKGGCLILCQVLPLAKPRGHALSQLQKRAFHAEK